MVVLPAFCKQRIFKRKMFTVRDNKPERLCDSLNRNETPSKETKHTHVSSEM